MFDLKRIRDNPEFFDAGWKKRGVEPQTQRIIELDEKRRAAQTELQSLQSKRNDASKKIGQVKAQGGDAGAIMVEVAGYKEKMSTLEVDEKTLNDDLQGLLETLPNIPHDDVPEGADEADNKEVRKVGEPKRLNAAHDHVDLGVSLGGIDFEAAAKMSGARFVVLRGGIARLERALGQFMLDVHTQEHGYTEMSVPLLVRDRALYGVGQLPKFGEDMFKTSTGHWMIPTSEATLVNTVMDTILPTSDLPIRMTALTPCFRSEAGSAGRDTRGMLRQHQFYKVEMVTITTEADAMMELERITECAESILKKLELPFRTVVLCAGDMGFGAIKTYDIEVWMPGQDAYREISSCSNCGDFQARRMNARHKEDGDRNTRYVHTLNGSGLAVGRCLIAVLENYQQLDGSVLIPDVLQPYMGGVKRLEPTEVKEEEVVSA